MCRLYKVRLTHLKILLKFIVQPAVPRKLSSFAVKTYNMAGTKKLTRRSNGTPQASFRPLRKPINYNKLLGTYSNKTAILVNK